MDEAAPTLTETLMELERVLHCGGLGPDRGAYEALTAQAFREVGGSGRCYDRDRVLDVVTARAREGALPPWAPSEAELAVLAPGVVLLTYLLAQGPRLTRRATVWRLEPQGWVSVYHQGTEAGTAPGA